MPNDIDDLLRRLIGGSKEAATEILADAARSAIHTRDRQLVAIATAHLDHDQDLLDVLVRDHLCEYPDSLLAAWIAAQPFHRTVTVDRTKEKP